MHELSIAMSIVEMAEEEATRRSARVSAVHLKMGLLSGVVKEALLFNYAIAREGTALEGSRLEIEEVPVTAYCPQCAAPCKIESIQWLLCPECKQPVYQILTGRDLEVVALELWENEHEPATAAGGS